MEKCHHEPCRRTADGADYCSPYCEETGTSLEISVLPAETFCRCGHPACRGGSVPPE
jgi:hypothetical protein